MGRNWRGDRDHRPEGFSSEQTGRNDLAAGFVWRDLVPCDLPGPSSDLAFPPSFSTGPWGREGIYLRDLVTSRTHHMPDLDECLEAGLAKPPP